MTAQKEEAHGAAHSLRKVIEAYKQSEVAEHVTGVQREFLLMMRSVLDWRIDQLSPKTSGAAKQAETK